MLQAMNTGHDGSLSTVHSNSARDALARIETMVLMAGYDLPMRAIRQQVASALDLIIHLERMTDGSRKVTAITEVAAHGGRRHHDAGPLRLPLQGRHGRPLAGRRAPAHGPAADVPREAGAPRHPAAGVHAAERGHGRERRARAARRSAADEAALDHRGRARAAGGDRVRRARGAAERLGLTEARSPEFPAARLRADAPGRAGAARGEAVGDRERGAGRRPEGRRAWAGSPPSCSRSTRAAAWAARSTTRWRRRAPSPTAACRTSELGIVFFSREPVVALEPTTDAAAIERALAEAPELPKGTRVYDAAASGVEMIKRAGVAAGSVIVLSDGADYSSVDHPERAASTTRSVRTCGCSASGCGPRASTRRRCEALSTNGGQLRRGRAAGGPRRHLLAPRRPAGARVPRLVPLAPAARVRRRRRRSA